MIYLINFLFVLIYYPITKWIGGQRGNKLFFMAVTIHAILFRALANPYNYVDTEVYAFAFDKIASFTFKESINLNNVYADWGIGYVFLNWLIGQFTHNPQNMFAIMAVISLLPVFYFYYKTSESILFTIVVYLLYPLFFYMAFGVIRQHVAIGFILLALYNIENFKYSIFWALLALSFHISACIFFPFYIWRYINRDSKNIGKSVLLIMLVFILVRMVLGSILMSLDRYKFLYGVQTEERNIVPVVFIGSLLLLLYYSKGYKRTTNSIDKNIWNFLLYGFSLSLVGIGTYGMGRMTLYFMYVFPVAITLLGKYRIEKTLYVAYKCVMLSLVIYLMMGTYNSQPYAYSFYWETTTRTW